MANNAKLIFHSGVLTGSEKNLDCDLLRIGRDPSNDLVIDDVEISRNHAKISCIEGDYILEDLNSTNGTVLNGRKIVKAEKLKNGDLITLGQNTSIEFLFRKEEFNPTKKDETGAPEKESGKIFNFNKFQSEKRKNITENSVNDAEKNRFAAFSKLPSWAIYLLIILGFVVIFCLIPLIFIEITNQWCNLFSGFFNAFSPGVCP